MSVESPDADIDQFLLVFVTVLHSIAAVTTSLRLWIRVRLHRLWWEDAWAALALCLNVICAVSTWTLTLLQRYPWYMSRESHIISMWLTLLSHTCMLWAARMSILFSLIRMIPPSDRMRSITSGFAVFFIFLWALCTASEAYTCGSDRSWYDLADFQCPIGLPTATIEFTSDVVSDVILVALPSRMLWRTLRLPRNERILMLTIFTMSLLSVMVSVVHIVFLIPVSGYTAGTTAHVEGTVGLTICNLLVLVTGVYRFFRNGEDIEEVESGDRLGPRRGPRLGGTLVKPRAPESESESESESLSLQTAMNSLTTVDLECVETMSVGSTQSAPLAMTRSEAIPGPVLHHLSSGSCLDAC